MSSSAIASQPADLRLAAARALVDFAEAVALMVFVGGVALLALWAGA